MPDRGGAAGGAGGSSPGASTSRGEAKLRLARDALTAAKQQARARGAAWPESPRSLPDPGGAAPANPDSDGERAAASRGPAAGERRPAAATSARRPRRDDPQPLGAAIEGLIGERGWELPVATGSVFGRWAQIVGPGLAEHTVPEALRDGELVVVADSTAWATQLRLLSAQLVRRLNAELGDGSVLRVKVRGPATTVRNPGEWRVRGSRGSRDTYG